MGTAIWTYSYHVRVHTMSRFSYDCFGSSGIVHLLGQGFMSPWPGLACSVLVIFHTFTHLARSYLHFCFSSWVCHCCRECTWDHSAAAQTASIVLGLPRMQALLSSKGLGSGKSARVMVGNSNTWSTSGHHQEQGKPFTTRLPASFEPYCCLYWLHTCVLGCSWCWAVKRLESGSCADVLVDVIARAEKGTTRMQLFSRAI